MAFPGLKFDEIDVEEIEESTEEIFFLFDYHATYFSIYKILRSYLNENYAINAEVLLALIKAHNIDIIKALHDIPFIHSGYVTILLEERNTSNGREDTESNP